MAFDDFFRVSAHAVIINEENKILQVKATYGSFGWGLPGGSLDPGETVHEALERECLEELGLEISILYLSGIYYHKAYNSQACVFRCTISTNHPIILSDEHSEFRYFMLDELSPGQRERVLDCLSYDGKVKSRKY